MGRHTLRFAELHGLSSEEASGRVRQFLQDQHSLNGEGREIEESILAYETRYEMSSTVMRQRLKEAKLEHTADICRWEMLLEMRDRVARIR
jgi:hypothetical protein